jgi:hypothetical protein
MNRTAWHEPIRFPDAIALQLTQSDRQILKAPIENNSEKFSSLLQPRGEKGNYWDFEIVRGKKNETIKLILQYFGQLPESYNIFIVDRDLELTSILQARDSILVIAAGSLPLRRFRLIAGESDYAQEHSDGIALIPTEFALKQNYPNPFNPITTIRFDLPRAGFVTLEIFNTLGQKVRTLMLNDLFDAGYHQSIWDGQNNSGQRVSSGLYLIRLSAGDRIQNCKAILLR